MIKFMQINNMPNFVKKEIDQLQEKVAPLTKKASRYMLWSFPLISVSIFNLIMLVFFTPLNNGSIITISIFALMGALGMALSKETKYKQKEIMHISAKYMVERINKSEVVSESRKQTYINRIKEQPLATLNQFIEFLNEENNKFTRDLY